MAQTITCSYCSKIKSIGQTERVVDLKYTVICMECSEKLLKTQNVGRCKRCTSVFRRDCTCTTIRSAQKHSTLSKMQWNAPMYIRKKPSEPGLPTVGLEIEVENYLGNPHVCKAKDISIHQNILKEECFIKHDGSLGMGGVEIVTQPLTLEVLKAGALLDNVEKLGEIGVHSFPSPNTGLHIHVGIEYLESDRALERLLKIVEYNIDDIKAIAARPPDRIRRYCRDFGDQSLNKITRTKLMEDRHTAVSVAHGFTVEFRFWKGGLTKRYIIDCIERSIKILDYAKGKGTTNKALKEICVL